MTTQPPRVLPFGTWPSPLSAATVASTGLRLSDPTVDGADIYWLEGRPTEGGRHALVRWRDGQVREVTPEHANVRTRVHEYGGGAFAVSAGSICYSEFSDHRLYLLGPDREASPLTPPGERHYADAVFDVARRRLLCVREDRTEEGREPVNTLVGLPLDGSAGPGVTLASGYDFYSTPRLSPDGSKLCWLCWRHPRMPWDGTELWVADVRPGGHLEHARIVAGADDVSVYQPGWMGDGSLIFASDRSGWWALERWRGDTIEPVLRAPVPRAEFGRPAWTFGTSTWAPAGGPRLLVSYTTAGRWRLAVVNVSAGSLEELAPGVEPSEWVAATKAHAVVVGGGPAAPDRVLRVSLADGSTELLRAASVAGTGGAGVSVAETVEFPTADGLTAHAFYYPPVGRGCVAPTDERPPLIVISHGGPTSAASATFSPRVQFWTSRGFAVADVNYGGSSGFGRAYRQRLDGAWGVVDVDDCVAAARWLAASGRADPGRLIIRGGSAGGFTTLAALAFRPGVFGAGTSYFGVSDIEALARDTHKFESRYMDGLVGPYPDARETYRARSPRYAADRISCPLILFQGLEDKVMPPNQSAVMADAVRAKGLPVAYLTFDGEGHGFRRAETIVRCLEAELYFYGMVFGFSPADALPPVVIDNRS